MHILICGGAGYVGSHAALALSQAGHEVTVLDNLSTGHREAVKWGRLVQADLLMPETLDAGFGKPVDAVMHFCARSLVGESVREPLAYYENNVAGTLNLLQAMRRHGVDRLVFSSTAAVFGNPVRPVIDEEHPRDPINPYGAGKLMVERILADAAVAYGLRSVSLRYFNAAGAAAEHGIGQALGEGKGLQPAAVHAEFHAVFPVALCFPVGFSGRPFRAGLSLPARVLVSVSGRRETDGTGARHCAFARQG